MKNTENDVPVSVGVNENVIDNAAPGQPQSLPSDAVRQDGATAVNSCSDGDVTLNESDAVHAADITSGVSDDRRYSFTAGELLELVALAHERGYRTARGHARRADEGGDAALAGTESAAVPAIDDKTPSSEKHAAIPAGRPVFMGAPRVGFWD